MTALCGIGGDAIFRLPCALPRGAMRPRARATHATYDIRMHLHDN